METTEVVLQLDVGVRVTTEAVAAIQLGQGGHVRLADVEVEQVPVLGHPPRVVDLGMAMSPPRRPTVTTGPTTC